MYEPLPSTVIIKLLQSYSRFRNQTTKEQVKIRKKNHFTAIHWLNDESHVTFLKPARWSFKKKSRVSPNIGFLWLSGRKSSFICRISGNEVIAHYVNSVLFQTLCRKKESVNVYIYIIEKWYIVFLLKILILIKIYFGRQRYWISGNDTCRYQINMIKFFSSYSFNQVFWRGKLC